MLHHIARLYLLHYLGFGISKDVFQCHFGILYIYAPFNIFFECGDVSFAVTRLGIGQLPVWWTTSEIWEHTLEGGGKRDMSLAAESVGSDLK